MQSNQFVVFHCATNAFRDGEVLKAPRRSQSEFAPLSDLASFPCDRRRRLPVCLLERHDDGVVDG
jgi:hypothetical protein